MKFIKFTLLLFPLLSFANETSAPGILSHIGEFFLKVDGNSCMKDRDSLRRLQKGYKELAEKHGVECRTMYDQKNTVTMAIQFVQEREHEFNTYLDKVLKQKIKIYEVYQNDEMISSVSIDSCEFKEKEPNKSSPLYLLTPNEILPLQYKGEFESELQTSESKEKIHLSEFSYKKTKLDEYYLVINTNNIKFEPIDDKKFIETVLNPDEISEINRKNIVALTEDNPHQNRSDTLKDCTLRKHKKFLKALCPNDALLFFDNRIITTSSSRNSGTPKLVVIAKLIISERTYFLILLESQGEKAYELVPEFGYPIRSAHCTPVVTC